MLSSSLECAKGHPTPIVHFFLARTRHADFLRRAAIHMCSTKALLVKSAHLRLVELATDPQHSTPIAAAYLTQPGASLQPSICGENLPEGGAFITAWPKRMPSPRICPPTWLQRCRPPSPACAPLMAQAAGVGVGTISGPLTMSPAPTNLICKAHKICLQSLNASCFCTIRYASDGLCGPQLSLGISGSYGLLPFQWTKIYVFLIVLSFCLDKNGLAASSCPPQGT